MEQPDNEPAGSLRSLGGDGRTFECPDPEVQRSCILILDSTPAAVVAIALDPQHPHYAALQYLLKNNCLTRKQYELLGDALVALQPGNVPKSNTAISWLVNNYRMGAAKSIHDAVGWNKYPDDNDESLDVTV